MRRAGQKRAASPTNHHGSASLATIELPRDADFVAPPHPLAPREPAPPTAITERQRRLELIIRQRIESRLPGRVRNLVVRAIGDTVLLEGQCSTYYTKQLAQHAAMGVLEEGEHLENAIIVAVPR
jgi:hypothetical protein